MTLFAGDGTKRPKPKRGKAKPAVLPKPVPPAATLPAAAAVVSGPLALSQTAQQLHDEVSGGWDLTPPVAALLRLVCEAVTKAEALEAVTAREGMTIADAKGAAKPHPAALLARDYRAQAASGLQRILSHLEK